MKVLLFGGTGILGKQITKKLEMGEHDFLSLGSANCSIDDSFDVYDTIIEYDPDIVIHCAGFVNTAEAEKYPDRCIEVNVNGTSNIVGVCRTLDKRLVYISSEYVFDGSEDEYTTESGLKPIGVYGLTKACGELIVKTLENHMIIRAPFWRDETFNVPKAFKDQYTCRQYVHEVVDDILSASFSKEVGVKHIVGKYQSLYDLAIETKPEIEGIDMPEKFRGILPMKIKLI